MTFRQDQLQQNEEIILQTNQHWITLARPFISALFTTIIVGVIAFAIVFKLKYNWGYWFLVLLVPGYLRFYWKIITRAHEEYIITNLRIVKQQGVFSKSSFDSSLEKINNVFHDQTLWGRMLGYGNVGLETASEQGTTVFRYIPNPVQFKNAIIAQQQSLRAKPLYVTTSDPLTPTPTAQDVPALLQKLGQLRDQGLLTPEEFETKKRELLSRL